MQIDFVEIQNFRKLKSIHVDLAKKTTLFVGANNSGKTSTMIALSRFLADQGRILRAASTPMPGSKCICRH
jgi:predicted ATP-dependent endonuclease of OLD family